MALHEFDYEKEPVVNIVKKIISDAINFKATDIHLDPHKEELLIRFRIDGDLIEYTTSPEKIKRNITTRIKILASLNITESNIPQTGTMNYKIDDYTYNMRVSSLPVIDGEKIVIHISNHNNTLENLDNLGFNEYNLNKIKNLLNNTSGTILIAGSTTSGKTTTLYSMLKELDYKTKNIITIENPIKIKLEGINQVQVAADKGLNTVSILNNVLLLDPNVIALSEISDIETACNALKASVTGRLVISTINSKNIYTTIDTLMNMDIENYLLSSSLTGVISQRLVKKLCPECREAKEPTEYEKEIFTKILNKNVKEIYIPKGCSKCINGYQGRIPLSEVIEINDSVRNAITNKKDRTNLRKLIYEKNSSIIEDGLTKVVNGETSLQEVIRIIDLNNDFDKEDESLKKAILTQLNEVKESNNDNKDEKTSSVNDTSISIIGSKLTDNLKNLVMPTQEETEKKETNNIESQNPEQNNTTEEKNEPITKEENNITENTTNKEETVKEENNDSTTDKEIEQKAIEEKTKAKVETEIKKVEEPKNIETTTEETTPSISTSEIKVKEKSKKRHIPTTAKLSTNQGLLKNIKKIENYDNFSYDDSYKNNF